MISDTIAAYRLVKDYIDDAEVMKAYFDPDGNLISGSKDIKLLKQKPSNFVEPIIFFKVRPVDGYTFLRMPVNPGGISEQLASWQGELPDNDWFRYIDANHISPLLAPNVRTNFCIIGYPHERLFKILKP